jgi:ABC-type uncharacterized transport system substrate-binding protein
MTFIPSLPLKTVFAAIMLLAIALTGCNNLLAAPSTTTPIVEADKPDYTGKKVFWVDSYHLGYEWSDGLEKTLENSFKDTGIELKSIHLDTKRNVSEEFGQAAGLKAKAEIDSFRPDVVIATDDNAQKYVVVPFLKDTDIPVVFIGINWDAAPYGYPAKNVTGMVEVELPVQLVNHLKQYAKNDRIGYVAADVETERVVVSIYNERFFNGNLNIYWAKSFAEFKQGFLKLQKESDIIFVSNNAGINDWNEAEAIKFFTENTTVPTGSVYVWMAPYTLMVLGKDTEEQGQWAAQTAMKILEGSPPSHIPLTENKKGKLIINLDIAEKLNIVFPPSLLKNAEIYPAKE